MPDLFKTFRQYAIEVLSALRGQLLEISANLTSPEQFDLVVESYAHHVLEAEFVDEEKDLYLRLTKSYNSKYGDYVSQIAQTSDYNNMQGGDYVGPNNGI